MVNNYPRPSLRKRAIGVDSPVDCGGRPNDRKAGTTVDTQRKRRSLNTVSIIGNIASRELIVREFERDGQARHVITFSVAVDGGGNLGDDENTGYFDVVCWNG